jgi:rod shape determining protein RodA
VETLRRNFRELDFTLIGVLVVLAVYSCVALLAATYGKTSDAIPTHIVPKQILFEVLGLAAMFLTAAYDYRSLRKICWWLYAISIVLLIVVFAFHDRQGAHSWIPLGVFAFQPSEFAKITLIIAVATHMATVDESEFPDYGFRNLWQIGAMFVVPFLLTLKEPALGQALVMFAIILVMYLVFAKRGHFILVVSCVVAVIIGLVVVATQFPAESTKFIDNVLVKHHLLQAFQAKRIETWLNPEADPLNSGYNVRQAQIAVGSGQIFGEGLFNGIETRGSWIPNQWTDYIFTAIAEEFGFIGSSVLILLYIVLIYRLVRIAGTSQDTFGTYLVMGLVGMFAFQVFENIGMDMYLSPSTGITLPFISYGGSSLIVNYIAIGLALSVALRRKKLRFN